MHVKDIRNNVVVAAGIDAGTGGVILLGDLPCEGKKAVNLSASLKIPGLIERTPAYDGGMVEISFNRLVHSGINAS